MVLAQDVLAAIMKKYRQARLCSMTCNGRPPIHAYAVQAGIGANQVPDTSVIISMQPYIPYPQPPRGRLTGAEMRMKRVSGYRLHKTLRWRSSSLQRSKSRW